MPGAVADAEVGAAFVEAGQRDFGVEGSGGCADAARRSAAGAASARCRSSECRVVMRTRCSSSRSPRRLRSAPSMSASALPAASASCRPSAVRVTPRAWRWNSGDAEPRFELAHVVADRAGGEVQFLGGVGEVLVAGGGFERRQGRQPVRAQGHGEPQIWFVAGAESMRLSEPCAAQDNARPRQEHLLRLPRMNSLAVLRPLSKRAPRRPGSPRSSSACWARSGAPRSCSCASPRRTSAPLRAGRGAAGAGRAGAAAVPVARARAVPAAPVAEARADRRDQLGDAVRAVRLGRAARAGRRRRDQQLR